MANHPESALEVRLDKWLWAARFYKTRSLARDQIDGGKVHYNGQRSKPGKQVEVGALIRFWQGQDEREVRVLAISDQRKSAPLAQQLYEETAESLKKRAENSEARRFNSQFAPSPERRPDKQERTIRAFGFRKLNDTVEMEDTPQIRGMIAAVHHLVDWEVIEK